MNRIEASVHPQTPQAAVAHHDVIRVVGARENNLKNISIDIPKRRLTVFTGVSGSGKSSLVFATIAGEAQRLINETYSVFVQGFLPTAARSCSCETRETRCWSWSTNRRPLPWRITSSIWGLVPALPAAVSVTRDRWKVCIKAALSPGAS